MSFVVNDRVKETTDTTGTGTLNLAGSITGFAQCCCCCWGGVIDFE